MEHISTRFWKYVDKRGPDDCWEWTGARHPKGYGHVSVGGSTQRAARVCFELVNGAIPDGLHVLHTCDNPPCINPSHLYVGTNSDNVADRDAKGRAAVGDRNGRRTMPDRTARGETHGWTTLTEAQVLAIIDEYNAGGVFMKDIGAKYGVSERTVCGIINGTSWTYLNTKKVPRRRRGGRERLTEDQVRSICSEYASGGVSYRELGEKYGIAEKHLGRIVRGQVWKSLPR